MNDKQLIREAMRIIGKRTSKRKAKSSAANIAKGREMRGLIKKKTREERISQWAKRYSEIHAATMNESMQRAKEMLCADCGKEAFARHHEDYEKPLEIIPLCQKCHIKRHRQKGMSWGRPKKS